MISHHKKRQWMNEHKPEGYIASPYGFAESTRDFYNNKLLPLVSRFITVLDPWEVDIEHILNAEASKQPELWLDLGDYHYDTIANKAKIMIAGLDQEPPDNGTVAEVAWAAAHNVPIVGYRGDLRTSGENGLQYNLMIGAAIRRTGGVAVSNLIELEQELQARVPSL